jgi:pimeloyl-ACP methyl ester carboxylesterase
MPFSDIRGQRLHYEDTGGAGPVLAFSHGLLMDASMWDAQVEALGGSYRCITWDERGHGQTGEASEDFTYEDSADDLLGLLDSLGIARATLVGMSQGGYVSQRAAVQQPGIAQALVFISTQATEEEPAKVAVYDMLIDAWESGGLTDELAETIAGLVIGPDCPESEEWITKWKRMDRTNLHTIYRALVTRQDFTPRLSELDVPALVIWGDHDPAISRDHARALAEGLPQGTLEVVAGAGHGVNFTHPQAVNPLLERFLELALQGTE